MYKAAFELNTFNSCAATLRDAYELIPSVPKQTIEVTEDVEGYFSSLTDTRVCYTATSDQPFAVRVTRRASGGNAHLDGESWIVHAITGERRRGGMTMPRKTVRGENGKIICEHYYIAGGHVYEIPRGQGQPRARVCFAETPTGDGEMLWEENGGAALFDLIRDEIEA